MWHLHIPAYIYINIYHITQFINKLINGRANSSIPASPLPPACLCIYSCYGLSRIVLDLHHWTPLLSLNIQILCCFTFFLVKFRFHNLFSVTFQLNFQLPCPHNHRTKSQTWINDFLHGCMEHCWRKRKLGRLVLLENGGPQTSEGSSTLSGNLMHSFGWLLLITSITTNTKVPTYPQSLFTFNEYFLCTSSMPGLLLHNSQRNWKLSK